MLLRETFANTMQLAVWFAFSLAESAKYTMEPDRVVTGLRRKCSTQSSSVSKTSPVRLDGLVTSSIHSCRAQISDPKDHLIARTELRVWLSANANRTSFYPCRCLSVSLSTRVAVYPCRYLFLTNLQIRVFYLR